MGKIVKLDEQLSNKIAAGEVVERPASIVKELVENSIDANSTHIIVEVDEAGLERIRILDNGDGIEADDVETAFFRHATSKIKTDQDLFSILTLGFRGEALPSIASVSHLELSTCTGNDAGTQIKLEGGLIKETKRTKSRKGTEIIVTQLFYNTPARLKYMKTIHTELGNVSDVMNRLALAHPEVSFELYHNEKELLRTSGNGDVLQVIASIYGISAAKQMVKLESESLDFKLRGYVAKPEVTRASRQYMSTFINGRYIKNFTVAKAIQEGYHTLLPIGRYPLVVLNIEMDPKLVDVNVHPAKLEVRLSKEEELFTLVKESIQKVFKKIQLIPELGIVKREKQQSEQMSFQFPSQAKARETAKHYDSSYQKSSSTNTASPYQVDERNVGTGFLEKKEQPSTIEVVQAVEETNTEEFADTKESVQNAHEYNQNDRVPTLYPIGQMHGTYILAQNDNGLYIIDQHAAQERIKYEYYRENVGKVSPELQELLVPYTLEFTNSEIPILADHQDELQKVGVFLEPFGRTSFIVRSHPTWFPKGEEQETIEEIINQVLTTKKVDIKKLREDAAIIMSCKGSIKANRHLRQDEMFALLESLRTCEDPFTCPHGRPILIHITTYEMEKMFKRIM
ncbi:DNA mismatch repair endonuclease MutL [Bacillus alkalicellulosilyticus]|uniref:DNA mismatch repair endonuclease MutL n=1 Tax=Alkalihalobacterium alkalicellulosilyticum TaxID=1912214 RepID=UPI000996F8FD|nr:DNA mismatch repair endonuclease MutL [Bacillus alkalicellulosilyticus]